MGVLHHITPSGASIVEACIRAADPEDRASRATAWAGSGSALHQLVEDAAAHGWNAALSAVPVEHFERAAGFDLAGLEQALGAPLSAFSWGVGVLYRPDTGEGVVLGKGLSRAGAHELAADRVKMLEGSWVVGLLDLAGIGEVNGATWVLVPDLKTGHQRPAPAASCTQTLIYALALAAAVGAEGARHGPLWAPEDLRPRWDRQDLDATGIFTAEQRISALFRAIEDSTSLPSEKRQAPVYGDHCRYCRQAHRCQAQAAALARLSEQDLRDADGTLLISAENAAEIYHRLRAAKKLLEDGEAALAAFASAHGPFPVGKGRVYGEHEHKEREVVTGRVYAALVREIGEDAARAIVLKATQSRMPIGRLEAAWVEAQEPDPAKRSGKGAGLKRLLDARLRAAGALVDNVTTRVGAHYPKKETT